MRSISLLLAAAVFAGCASAPRTAPRAPAPRLPREVHWARDAAEHDALVLQVYRAATDRVDALARGLPAASWAVILDADETVLDNSAYYRARSEGDATQPAFDAADWNAWVARAEASALPGAAAFIARVKGMGGRVAIVTNRDEAVCAPTRENFRRLGIAVDEVLCRPRDTSDKNPRFAAVEREARVLLWIGDNIQDFPALDQSAKDRGAAALTEFGARFFVLPNPMYGSWEGNALH